MSQMLKILGFHCHVTPKTITLITYLMLPLLSKNWILKKILSIFYYWNKFSDEEFDFLLLECIQWWRIRWSRRWHKFHPIRTNSSLQRIKGKVRVGDISFCHLVCQRIVISYCLNNLFYTNICQFKTLEKKICN
jgi:hypothetical protein